MIMNTSFSKQTLFVSLVFALAGLFVPSVQADTTIVIVRHGEKPPQGLGQLTCQGLNRSLALAPLLLSRYGKPTAVYAPNPAIQKMDHGVPYAYVRPLATIQPLAIRVGLPVNVEWGMTEIEPLAARILASPSGTHMVAWEHHLAVSLAKHLVTRLEGNPDEVPKWADDDFDSIFVIRISAPGKVVFSRERQGLDNLPDSCGEGMPRS